MKEAQGQITLFKGLMEQFNQFLKSEQFIHFILTSSEEIKQDWKEILDNSGFIYSKIHDNTLNLDDLKKFNDKATSFFDMHALNDYKDEANQYLKNLMKK